MRRTQSNVSRYFVSYMSDLDVALETTVTPDAAFFAAAELAKKTPFTLVMWSWNDDSTRRVRAYAHNGVATWAKECTKCKGKAGSCYACNGLGATT